MYQPKRTTWKGFLPLWTAMLLGALLGNAADLPPGPNPNVPSNGMAPGDYPNFSVTGANVLMDASAVTSITGNLRHEIKMNFAGQGPLPWSFTSFGQGRFAPRLNVADPQKAAVVLNTLPFDLIIDGSSYEWENDIDPWAPNGAAWRPHPARGILLSTARKNGQVWNDGEPRFYGTMSTPVQLSGGEGYSMIDGSFGDGDMEISVGKAGADLRGSIDTSIAWFPYDQGWLGGHVASADFEQGEWLQDGFHHPDLPADPGQLITWSREFGIILPPVNLRLPDIHSRNDGMLFTTSVEMANSNTRLTAVDPRSDGNGWDIMIRLDNEPDPDFAEENALSFAFLYVPYTSGRLIGGHIRGTDANVINGRGTYEIKRLAEGQYELNIPGKKGSDGMLLLQATGRVSGRSGTISRSFLSYEPTEDGLFVIESRYYQSPSEQPLENTDFYFVWVDFATPLSPPGFETIIEPPTITQQPSGQAIELGASATFSVSASGSEPFIYQWIKNGVAIEGATEPSYSVSGASLDDAGEFTVEITNDGGKVVSQVAELKVLAPPSITRQPQSADASTGETVRFSVTASGTPPLSYQWQKNGVDLPEATDAELVLTELTLGDAGQYRVRVSNEVREEFSVSARLTVQAVLSPPVITSAPSNATVMEGETAEFTVAASGTPPLSYQWQFNGNDISGATQSTLVVRNSTANQQGSYRVVVTNPSGSVTSDPAQLTVTAAAPNIEPPQILQQPAAVSVETGAAARFQVIASGSMLTFQWSKNDSPIGGANQAALEIPSVEATDAGQYQVVVQNGGGRITSLAVTLTVTSPPPPADDLSITSQPESQTVPPGTNVTFTVVASGAGSLTYQWQLGNFNIPGARSASFMIPNVQEVDAGSYFVVVSDGTGSVRSNPAVLVVSSAPVVTVQPQSQSIVEGDSVTFTVEAQGEAPLSYQWQYNGINIPGARGQQFSVDSVSAADQGNYQVAITDSGGTTVSDSAILTVVDRPDTPTLRITRISLNGNTLSIEWEGGPGVVLQAKASLADANWQDVPGTDGQSSTQQLALGLSAYFRLIQR